MGRRGRARKQERRADHVLAVPPARAGWPPSRNGSFLTETKSGSSLEDQTRRRVANMACKTPPERKRSEKGCLSQRT